MRQWFIRAGLAALLVGPTLSAQTPAQAPGQVEDTRQFLLLQVMRDTGRNVAPVYEGWEPGADGTVRMYFGYMNRNWKQELDIPLGASNIFEPGPADRGQPTHFMPRRQKQVFSVVVPKDSAPIVWTLTIAGVTEKVTASLAPSQQISVAKDSATGNTAPTIKIPATVTSASPLRAALAIVVNDDGLPRGRAGRGLNVTWSKYRGPGDVTFVPSTMATGRGASVSTTARFSVPGTYMIRATVADGSVAATGDGSPIPGFSCCWANGLTTVTVKAAGASSGGDR